MPNRNYANGRSREYRIMDKLRDQGCDIVARTAGSHSPIDIIAINQKDRTIQFIQSKPKKFSNKATTRILDSLFWLNGAFTATFGVMSRITLPKTKRKLHENTIKH